MTFRNDPSCHVTILIESFKRVIIFSRCLKNAGRRDNLKKDTNFFPRRVILIQEDICLFLQVLFQAPKSSMTLYLILPLDGHLFHLFSRFIGIISIWWSVRIIKSRGGNLWRGTIVQKRFEKKRKSCLYRVHLPTCDDYAKWRVAVKECRRYAGYLVGFNVDIERWITSNVWTKSGEIINYLSTRYSNYDIKIFHRLQRSS